MDSGKTFERTKAPWRRNEKPPPPHDLETLEEGEIPELGGFTAVLRRNKKGKNGAEGSSTDASTRPGSAALRTSKPTQPHETTPYPLTGTRQQTTQSGAVDWRARANALSPPAKHGMGGTIPNPLQGARLAPSYAASHASINRSAVYSRKPALPTVAGHQGDERVPLRAQRDPVVEKAQYKPGMIIHAVLPEPDGAKSNTPSGQSSTVSAAGDVIMSAYGPIFIKARPMIVVALHEKHYVAVPCYTHSGKGIGHRNPDEYITVHDHRSTQPLAAQDGYLTEKSTLQLIQLCQKKAIPSTIDLAADRVAPAQINLQKEKVAYAELQTKQLKQARI
ncbi:hypothetical protein MMC13_002855 [Lambiella insularis]|nr:hypothetical protein [Lambiella insularis]